MEINAYVDSDACDKKLPKSPVKLKLADISGYITAVYEANWWLGYVLQENEKFYKVKITFLHPAWICTSFTIQEILMFCGSQ